MYVAGGPIEEPEDFYGRGAMVEGLLTGRDRHIFLLGLRRTGKTSVLKALERAAQIPSAADGSASIEVRPVLELEFDGS